MGTWCMLAHDIDRQVFLQGQKSWSSVTTSSGARLLVDSEMLASIMEFLQRTVLDPQGVYLNLNPVAPVAAPTPGIKKPSGRYIPAPARDEPESNKADEESDLDRDARLRFGALCAFRWLLGKLEDNTVDYPQTSIDARFASDMTSLDDLSSLLSNQLFWTALYCGRNAPWIPDPEIHGFGHGQPQVRQATWALLFVLLQRFKGGLRRISFFMELISIQVLLKRLLPY